MKISKEAIAEFMKSRMKFASLEALANFVNARNLREKMMILAFAGALLFFADYFILVRPVFQVFQETLPELGTLQGERHGFKNDQKNKAFIEKTCAAAKDALAQRESGFIAPNEVPRLLENLSKLALDSGVKIISLQPIETNKKAKKEEASRYSRIPIQVNAAAGAHELGKFLARLEGGQTYFRVMNMRIQANPADMRRHSIELDIDALGKG